MNSPTTYVIHGLTETDGDSRVFAVLESSLPKHKIKAHLKKFWSSLLFHRLPTTDEITQHFKALGDRVRVKYYNSIDIDDL
jgi:hypothetical protein